MLSANKWLFTGELQDSRVARQPLYLRARYYDPALGRFLTRDPWPASRLDPQSWDRYVYVYNNPARFVDPYGYFGWQDAIKCALNPFRCALDAVLDRMPGGDLVRCALEHGVPWCITAQAAKRILGEQTCAKIANRIGNLFYVDVNATATAVIGVTVGAQWNPVKGVHPYFGPAVGVPGISSSLTVAPLQSIQEGPTCSVQYNAAPIGPAAQVGQSHVGGDDATGFYEGGIGGATNPGLTGACYIVW